MRQLKVIGNRRRALLAALLTMFMLLLATGIVYANAITVVDDGGADDFPGQKDLNQLTVDTANVPTSVALSWNWDDTAWTGVGNTGDACSLFDTDGDGLANYALCVTVAGDPAVYQATRLYSCGDAWSDRCGQPTTLIQNFASTCTAAVVSNADPFGVPSSPYYTPSHVTGNTCGNTPGCYTADTVAACTVALSDLGGATDPFLLNVCSYPSQEPNSDPSECVFVPNSGFLTIVKVARPNDGTPFSFTSSAPSQGGDTSWTINGSSSVSLISFAPATTYDLTEAIPSGWVLESASCAIQTSPSTSTGIPGAPPPVPGPANAGVTDFEIRQGFETICTFIDSSAPTPTSTPTSTPTNTPTNTPTSTPTNAPTATPTHTPTNTPTHTPTATPTQTATATPTNTPVPTTLVCNDEGYDFDDAVPPPGWSVVNNLPDGPQWTTIAGCGEQGNYATGNGGAACASGLNYPDGNFDTELRSPVFSLAGWTAGDVNFQLNFQSWAGTDRLAVDISTDGGATWSTIRTYLSDQGALQSLPGVNVNIDLTPWAGQADLMLRWRYYSIAASPGWYAQVDEVKIKCAAPPPTAVSLATLDAASNSHLSIALSAGAGLALAAVIVLRRKRQRAERSSTNS